MLVGLQLCMETMGSGGSEGTESITFHQYTGVCVCVSFIRTL